MQEYADSRPFTILSQTGGIHAVRHDGLQAVGAVFWEPGAVDLIAVDRPCLVFYQKTANTLTLAASDPTHGDDTVRVRAADEGVPPPPGGKGDPASGKPDKSATGGNAARSQRSRSAETTFHVTVNARLAAVNLPGNVTIAVAGNQTTITFHARDGLNSLAKFAIVDR